MFQKVISGCLPIWGSQGNVRKLTYLQKSHPVSIHSFILGSTATILERKPLFNILPIHNVWFFTDHLLLGRGKHLLSFENIYLLQKFLMGSPSKTDFNLVMCNHLVNMQMKGPKMIHYKNFSRRLCLWKKIELLVRNDRLGFQSFV